MTGVDLRFQLGDLVCAKISEIRYVNECEGLRISCKVHTVNEDR